MKTQKNLGIYMSHAEANLIDLNDSKNNRSIVSKFTFDTKEEALQKGESSMHNKEQELTKAYYKSIADAILNYNNVLLFGPTDAKKELYNLLKKDLHFKNINIDLESADNMSDPEKEAYVKKHFELLVKH